MCMYLRHTGLHPVSCPDGSLLNSFRMVLSDAQQQPQTFHVEYTCLRTPLSAPCSRATANSYKSGPAKDIRFRTTEFRALLDMDPKVGDNWKYLELMTSFRVFLDTTSSSTPRISAEWTTCQLPDSFTSYYNATTGYYVPSFTVPARVNIGRSSDDRAVASYDGISELGEALHGVLAVPPCHHVLWVVLVGGARAWHGVVWVVRMEASSSTCARLGEHISRCCGRFLLAALVMNRLQTPPGTCISLRVL